MLVQTARENAIVECGWGRLIFAQTFRDNAALAEAISHEQPGRRDVALYPRDPHVLLAFAPQELFLDPSHTYRLSLEGYRSADGALNGFSVRRARITEDHPSINRIYATRHMVPIDPAAVSANEETQIVTYLVAEDSASGEVIGTVIGVDHHRAFGDPEMGSSLWALAVDPQVSHPGVGEALVRRLAEHYQALGRSFMDLSVMHDNAEAIALYEKLGFVRVPEFCVKRKNPINEPLFIAPAPEADLNPYAQIIVREARRRGIAVEVLDEEANYFRLSFGGRSVVCRESLTELTSSIAMSRCDDKAVTRRVLAAAGLNVPAQQPSRGLEADRAFLQRYRRVVVKPARGEQGHGVSVDVRSVDELRSAIDLAHTVSEEVLLEEYVEGQDLRIVVIGFEVVAAAVRRPPQVVGTGQHTIRELIEKQSRRRAAATGGESTIPLDRETERCVARAGFSLDSVLPRDEVLKVRKTANLHSGGTIHDVTDLLHPSLAEAAVRAARALDIPVTGLDFLVPNVDGEEYVIIEANERPGLANHEPQPTAERFIDLLFPDSGTR